MRTMPIVLSSILITALLAGCASTTDTASVPTTTTTTTSVSSSHGTASGPGTTSAATTSASTSTSAPPAANQAPVINSFKANITGMKATLSFNATDADKDGLSFALSFGDNSANATGNLGAGSVSHTFATAGNYTATLVIKDGKTTTTKTLLVAVVVAQAGYTTVQTLACDIAVGLPGPGTRVLGSNLPVVGRVPGVGGCLTDAVGQDSILTAVSFGAECKLSPATAIGASVAKDATFNIFCDQTVMQKTESITLSI